MNKYFKFYARKLLLILIDFLIVYVGSVSTYGLFQWLSVIKLSPSVVLTFALAMSFVTIIGMLITGMYKNIWRYASLGEILKCAIVNIGIWVVCYIALVLTGAMEHLSEIYCIFAFEVCSFLIVMSRCAYRVLYTRLRARKFKEKNINTLIVGAGFSGNAIINEINRSESEFLPVAIVDDDKQKQGRFIHGVKVVGAIKDIPKVVQHYRVEKIIVAIPSCNSQRRKEILDLCGTTKKDIRILPYMHKLAPTDNFLQQVKEIKIEDLLGRDPIQFDKAKNRELIEGKICLVTGGGGSIGSELCRQIAVNKPKQLIIVDIYENNAYDIQQELIRQYGDKLNLVVRIASVRDYDKMNTLFDEFRPELVFHAAAHKHVPLMEDSPAEAIKNNVLGTYNVVCLAQEYSVQKFVLVSTDKAVNPTNVMGATKRCCEMIVEYMKQISRTDTEYVAVRFGNVLGSNGSVVPLFKEQIKHGGPVTVTHPDIIRYFMTIPEATSLILQAASFAHGGEIFVLDMGEPVKILSLAENVIKLSGKKPYEEIKIEFTGLRPGEKLYEELLMGEEGLAKTENNKIFIGKQTELDTDAFIMDIEKLREAANANDNELSVQLLEQIVPTFKHKVIAKV